MVEFIQQYWGSILVGAGLLALVAFIIVNAVRVKLSGGSSCGGDCAHCGGCRSQNTAPLHKNNTK